MKGVKGDISTTTNDFAFYKLICVSQIDAYTRDCKAKYRIHIRILY